MSCHKAEQSNKKLLMLQFSPTATQEERRSFLDACKHWLTYIGYSTLLLASSSSYVYLFDSSESAAKHIVCMWLVLSLVSNGQFCYLSTVILWIFTDIQYVCCVSVTLRPGSWNISHFFHIFVCHLTFDTVHNLSWERARSPQHHFSITNCTSHHTCPYHHHHWYCPLLLYSRPVIHP